jgi:hypothetical protein
MKSSRVCGLLVLGAAVMLGGCAHQVTIAPDAARLVRDDAKPRIEKQVGYHISEPNRVLQVTTPAGGGDSVKYPPYADLEAGINKVLSNVFAAVHVVRNPQDREFLKSKNISYVFTPTITTTSSSRNNFFWPPTDFAVTIDCVAADDQSQTVWSAKVQADGGLLAVKDTLTDHGIAGRRAAENALTKLQAELESAAVFRK